MTEAKHENPDMTAKANADMTRPARLATAKKTTKKQATSSRKAAKRKAAGNGASKPAAAKTPTRKTAKARKTVKKAATKKQPPNRAQRQPEATENPNPKPASDTAAEEVSKSLYADFDSLSEYLTDITGRSQEVLKDFVSQHPEYTAMSGEMVVDPLNVGEALQELVKGMSMDPGTVMQRQFKLWGDYAKLMANTQRRLAGEKVKPAASPSPGDKRFRHEAWETNPMLDFVKQSYLIASNWLVNTVEELEGLDEHEHKKAVFYTRQFADACSPTNFAMLNPEVVEATLESRGENLLRGFQHFLEDLDRGDGKLAITQADTDHFKLGENVATTPGKIVFQNDIIQLIQYEPMTEKVAKRPLLILPPWINKYYILDLQPQNSFVRWMVEQGRTVFLVSWVNPGPELRNKTFQDYIQEGLFAALGAVEKSCGEKHVDAIGYCIGGTMLMTALALMAKRGDDRIKSATFFTAQGDFTEAGDLQIFVDDAQLDAIAKQMDAAGGVLEGRAMATTFNMLRSNDLIWSFVIDNYLKGKDPAKFDLLFWNSDATRMPKNVHLFYLREFYQNNRLATGEMVIDGEQLSLGDISIPVFMQAGETDHIAPARSIYNTAKLLGGNVHYMLAGSGHIAGVVNHPAKNKYHHATNDSLPATIEEWQSGAQKHPGSWWPHWISWLNQISPGTVKARFPGEGKLPVLEEAPGSYVKVRA